MKLLTLSVSVFLVFQRAFHPEYHRASNMIDNFCGNDTSSQNAGPGPRSRSGSLSGCIFYFNCCVYSPVLLFSNDLGMLEVFKNRTFCWTESMLFVFHAS